MKHRLLRVVMMALAVMTIGVFPVHGAGRTGSLTLDLQYVDEATKTPISGANITIYQVWEYDDESNIKMLSPFQYANASSIDEDTTAEEIQALTNTFLSQKNGATSAGSGTSDGNGKVGFNDLTYGLYLVVQEEPAEVSGTKYFMAPFLVTVPYRQEGETDYQDDPTAYNKNDDTTYVADVTAAPKFVVTKEFNVLKIDEETGDVLPGATLVITDNNGDVVKDIYGNRCEWVTGNEKKTFFLPAGTYILKETKVPSGYAKAKDIHFQVDENFDVHIIDETGTLQPAESNDIIMEDPVAPPSTTTPPKTTPPPTTPPNTGDYQNMTLYGGMFIGAVALIVVLYRKLAKDRNA